MYGAILGDIIGSPYEFTAWNYKAKDFPLFSDRCYFTDDTVMTLAVAEALMESEGMSDAEITAKLFEVMPRIGRHYPDCGYGERFGMWIMLDEPCPYNSYGNGSAMRVSPVAWLYNDLETVLHMAEVTASVSHNHPEGIKGAQAVAAAIFLARTGHSKDEIRSYVTEKFGYDLTRTCDEIRPEYRMDETCQGSVPEAIIAFLESTDFEDAIRTAVSIGGDSDTIADMAGAIAEGFYGVPEELKEEARNHLTYDLRDILYRFEERINGKVDWKREPVLTERQKLLIACLKAYGFDRERGLDAMTFLKTEKQQDEMLSWMRNHTTASQDDVLERICQIVGL